MLSFFICKGLDVIIFQCSGCYHNGVNFIFYEGLDVIVSSVEDVIILHGVNFINFEGLDVIIFHGLTIIIFEGLDVIILECRGWYYFSWC